VGENSAGNQRTCRKPENMQETRHAGNQRTCRKPENMQETRHSGNQPVQSGKPHDMLTYRH